jgi:formylglycine-generating enzyme required for sulfatase activity
MTAVLRINNINYIRKQTTTEYFDYATQSNDIPNTVAANSIGDGIASLTDNSVNYNFGADWSGQNGNVTTVGTNGSPSFYETYDQCGQVWEWNDSVIGLSRGVRGGSWLNTYEYLGSLYSGFSGSSPTFGNANVGFRLARLVNIPEGRIISNILDLVKIGDINNSPDNTGYGSVSYEYMICKYPITNDIWCEFLNEVASSTDPYFLYNINMTIDVRGGINRSGSAGSYTYTVKDNMGNKPVNFISWFDAARLANWLHTGGFTPDNDGDPTLPNTEDGAYTLSGGVAGIFTKNPNAIFWVPSEDEWYKAAFYKQQTKFYGG